MPRPREVQRLQPWSGWGGSFRGALPGAGPGWGPHRLHPILRLPLSGRDCSGGDHDWFYTPPPPGAGERQRERERDRAGELQSETRGVAVGPSSPALRSSLQIVTPELALGCCLASLHPSVWSI